MQSRTLTLSRLSLALLASASLISACGREGTPAPDQKADQAIVTNDRKADEVVAGARQAASEVRQGVGEATDAAAQKSKDAGITMAIKSRLAADTTLSALAINVDTDAGRVVLRGSAPDTAARGRAAELARAVDGVVSVQNDLMVQRTN